MEVSVPPQGLPPNGLAPTASTGVEPELMVKHLAAVCEIALGATQHDLEQEGNMLHASLSSETVSRCSRFANDTQNVLYILKEVAQPSMVENSLDGIG